MNLRAYMELLRTDVRKQKANIMGQVMQFDADDVAKFWPIYKEYDAELARIGDEKLAMIKKYADNYENMTDAVADQLVRAAIQIDQQRHDLKAKYYGRVKDALGGNARQIDFLSRSGQTLNFPSLPWPVSRSLRCLLRQGGRCARGTRRTGSPPGSPDSGGYFAARAHHR